MGKLKKIRRPKAKITWPQFAKFWSARGLGPEEATNVIAEHWLDQGWNDGVNFNMFKDPENQKLAMDYLDYIHNYMAAKKLKFKAACLKLAKVNDPRTIDTLAFLLVPRAVDLSKGKILVAPATFAKWCGWWRNYLFSDEYLEEIKEIEKDINASRLTKKKKAKKK
jgi:hypothetical protein